MSSLTSSQVPGSVAAGASRRKLLSRMAAALIGFPRAAPVAAAGDGSAGVSAVTAAGLGAPPL